MNHNSNEIDYLHERCLLLIYSDKTSSYSELLQKAGRVSIHDRNIKALVIEMYKIKNGVCPCITSDMFNRITGNFYTLETNLTLGYSMSEMCIMTLKGQPNLALKYGILFVRKLDCRIV